MKKYLVYASSVLFFFFSWIILEKVISSQIIFPDLKSVFFSCIDFLHNSFFYKCLLKTILRIFEAFIISTVAGFFIGLVCSLNKYAEYFFEIPLAFLRAVPVVSVILILLFWTSSDWTPVLCAVLMCLPIMITSVFEGLKKNDAKIIFLCNIFGINKFEKFLFYNLPEFKINFFEGIKNICALSWKVVCASEVLCLPKYSLGFLLQNNQILLESDKVFALTILIVFFSFIFSKIVLFIFYKFTKIYKLFTGIYFASFREKQINLNNQLNDILIENLSIEKNGVQIFKDFTCSFKKGSVTKISGYSGKGKTTLLNYIAQNSSGNIVSFAFQENTCFSSLTLLQNIQLPLLKLFGSKKSRAMTEDIIKKLNLESRKKFYPAALSTGQKQKLNIARAFVFPSTLLLLDEIYSSQDEKSIENINQCINEFCNDKTVIFCSHQESFAQSVNSINISN